jgi:hypothetical protein
VRAAKLCAVGHRGYLAFAVWVGVGAALLPPSPVRADVAGGSADDPENQLWDCSARRVAFGDPAVDTLRCLTFRFDPPDDITSAVLYLDIDAPTNSLQDTDSLVVAVGEPFDECVPAQGAMAGCVTVHGGFQGGERSLVVDLANLACDPSAPIVDAVRQQAVLAQLATGVVHVMLQDDTAVNGAWLDVNGEPPPATCGTQTAAVPVAIVNDQTGSAPGPSDEGGLGSVPKIAIAAAGAAVVAAAGTAAQRARVKRRIHPRVAVRRVPDAGHVEMNDDRHGSVAIAVRSVPDELGSQDLIGVDT